ncbi:hypothetical protein [Pectobacterium sp. B1J-3]|uniref:hypothetical protein n=1 Tax=Pectobacterium sp. B1J-3 TaxID=3385371 RepID=UPI0039065EA6
MTTLTNENLKHLRELATQYANAKHDEYIERNFRQGFGCDVAVAIIDRLVTAETQLAELEKQEPLGFINGVATDGGIEILSPVRLLDTDVAVYSRPVPPAAIQIVSDELTLTDEQIDAVLDSRGNLAYVIADKRERLRLFARDILRAAMFRSSPVQPAMPDNVVTAEHQLVIEMLLSVCGAAFELADDACNQEVDGEMCHVVPNDSFVKLSDALDKIENTLPSEYADIPNITLQWAAVPRHALRTLLQSSCKAEQLKNVTLTNEGDNQLYSA